MTPWLGSCRDLGEELMKACSCELCLCVTSHPRLRYLKSCSRKTAEILKLITSYISHIGREDDEGFRMKGGKNSSQMCNHWLTYHYVMGNPTHFNKLGTLWNTGRNQQIWEIMQVIDLRKSNLLMLNNQK